jgi:pyridinium-3,5-biscarboxylic acid mononucleotide sulfurtransferase
MNELLDKLAAILADFDRAAIAVSGGVDSMTLATIARQVLGDRGMMFHAVSPAVPAEATLRVEAMARNQGWRLCVFDAGEFADPNYRANPVNRCFFCKTNLYGAIRTQTEGQILSGTNLDDLGEYRPGLDAARQHGVRHPYVEAGIGKPGVREIARALGLQDVAELPAAPCLSSRVETGIPIRAPTLRLIHQAERLISGLLSPRTVRCRVRASGVVIELDEESLARALGGEHDRLQKSLTDLLDDNGIPATVSFAPYRNGSAFLRATR